MLTLCSCTSSSNETTIEEVEARAPHVSRDDGRERVCSLADGRLAARAAHRRRALQFDQLLVHERPRVARVPTQLLLQQALYSYEYMYQNAQRTELRVFRTLNSGDGVGN